VPKPSHHCSVWLFTWVQGLVDFLRYTLTGLGHPFMLPPTEPELVRVVLRAVSGRRLPAIITQPGRVCHHDPAGQGVACKVCAPHSIAAARAPSAAWVGSTQPCSLA